jgi:hypothetical protein
MRRVGGKRLDRRKRGAGVKGRKWSFDSCRWRRGGGDRDGRRKKERKKESFRPLPTFGHFSDSTSGSLPAAVKPTKRPTHELEAERSATCSIHQSIKPTMPSYSYIAGGRITLPLSSTIHPLSYLALLCRFQLCRTFEGHSDRLSVSLVAVIWNSSFC